MQRNLSFSIFRIKRDKSSASLTKGGQEGGSRRLGKAITLIQNRMAWRESSSARGRHESVQTSKSNP